MYWIAIAGQYSHYGTAFGSFPIKGEGWDGGEWHNQTLNPHPNPPPDKRRGLKAIKKIADEEIKQGKKIKILVICNGDHVKKAESAGADFVGAEDMIEKVLTEKWVGFDVVICIPELMPKVAKLGQVLGPKGIMPSPKMGTVTNDVEKAIKDAKAGRIELKNDKLGLVNFPFGKKSFEITKILDNLYFLVQSLNKSKPASSKGNYLKKVSVSSTMGPGFKIDISLLKEELKEYNGASA